jgi:HEAT repeat protein
LDALIQIRNSAAFLGTLIALVTGVIALSAWQFLWPMWCVYSDSQSLRVVLAHPYGSKERDPLDSIVQSMQTTRGDDHVITVFSTLIADDQSTVRREAAKVLSSCLDDDGSPITLNLRTESRLALLDTANRLLADSDPDNRVTAVRLAHYCDSCPALISFHIRAMRDENRSVRETASYELMELGRSGVPAVIDLLKDSDESVRHNAAFVLKVVAKTPELVEALTDHNKEVRVGASFCLLLRAPSGLDSVEAVPALILALNDNCNDVRFHAAGALGQLGPDAKSALPALIGALGDSDKRVRVWAARSIFRLDPQQASIIVPEMVKLLDDDDRFVRLEAAWNLSQIDPDAAALAEPSPSN